MSGRTGASGTEDVALTVFLSVVSLVALALLLFFITDLFGSLPDPLPAL